MVRDGITIKERFNDTTDDLLFAILEKLTAMEGCMCGGNSNIIEVPIYTTYDLPAGTQLVSILFPAYGTNDDPITYHAIVGTDYGADDLAEEFVTTNLPVTVNLGTTFSVDTTIYYQSTAGAEMSAEPVAWLRIILP